MAQKLNVLVTGATGKQGGMVARALRARGHTVRGMTRTPDGGAADRLREAGIEPTVGDLSEPASLVQLCAETDAVFAMTTPFETGTDAEIRQGVAIVDAAKQAGVGHLVFSSVANADRKTGIPHFDSKLQVERHLVEAGIGFTTVAPVYFMENLLFAQNIEALRNGTYATPLPPECTLAQVALADVGEVVASVIERPDEFMGQRIDIASHQSHGLGVAAALSERLGRKIEYQQLSMDVVRSFSEDMALMYQWFMTTGYDVDIPALHQRFPEVSWHTFAAWAAQQELL